MSTTNFPLWQTLFVTLSLLFAGSAIAQSESEPNDAFSSATSVAAGADISGSIKCLLSDNADFYLANLPDDGKLSVTVKFANDGDGMASASTIVYNSQQGSLASGSTGNFAAGETKTTTLTLDCRQADDFYFRISASGCLSYTLRYEHTAPSGPPEETDSENFDDAIPMAVGEALRGRIGYRGAAGTDATDFYRATLPDDGTLTMTIEYTNNSGGLASASTIIYNSQQGSLASGSTGNFAAGEKKATTLTLDCRQADDFYFRISASGCLSYTLRYEHTAPSGPPEETDSENFDDAIPMAVGEALRGRIGYRGAAGTDATDFYRATLPDDGTLIVTVEYTNNSGGLASASTIVYNSRQGSLASGSTGNFAAGETRTTTLTLDCRQADDFYFRLSASACLSYTVAYEHIAPPGPLEDTDSENFEDAIPVAGGEAVRGRIGYRGAAGTDAVDVYRATLPDDGRLVITIEYTNNSGGLASASTIVYNSRQGSLASGSTGNFAVGESRTTTLTLDCRQAGDFYFRISASGCLSYTLRYEHTAPKFGRDEEANETIAEATNPLELGEPVEGHIGFVDATVTDQNDYFKLPATSDRVSYRIRFEIGNENAQSASSITLWIVNEQGGVLGSQTYRREAGGSLSQSLEFSCITAGQHYLRITSSACFSYRMRVNAETTEPSATLSYSRFGNRFAFATDVRNTDKLLWDFGDGTTSDMRFPVKEFPVGEYAVRLSATNEGCNQTTTENDTITVNGIESYYPDRAGKAEDFGFFAIRFFGAGFSDDTEVRLTRGSTVLMPTRVRSPGSVEFTAMFDFEGVETGTYDLAVTLSSGQTYNYPGGFTIEQDEPGFDIQSEVVGPTRIRTNRWTNYTINVTNDRKRIANGVTVGVVIPRGVEANLNEVINRRSGQLLLKGETWDRLSLNRDDFDELFFAGTFDPNVDTVLVDYDAIDAALGEERGVEIDTLYEEPVDGTLYLLYFPILLNESTVPFHFQLRSSVSQQVKVITYAHPEPTRNNPLNGKELDAIKNSALEAAAVLEILPVPAFKLLGKWVGWIDIGSQIVATEVFDRVYGTNVADTDFYRNRAYDAIGEKAGDFLPFGARGDAYTGAAVEMRRRVKRTAKRIDKVESQLAKTGKGRLKKARKKFEGQLDHYNIQLANQEDLLTTVEKYAVIDGSKNYVSKKGINYAKNQGKDALGEDPEDACSTRPKEIEEKSLTAVRSFDPNAIYGNAGVGSPRYVRPDEQLSCLITFENVDTAEAAAQIVRVQTRLDPAIFDLRQTEIGNVFLGDRTYALEENRQEYFTDVDLRPANDLIVRISVKLDTITGDFNWQFLSLDPRTMALTEDVDAGFLPPNVLAPEGEGGVYFSTRLRPEVVSGDRPTAQATIFFDDNDPILTNTWSNVVDATDPGSELSPVYTQLTDSTVQITYSGQDEGSGLKDYYLIGRRVGEPWSHAEYPLLRGGSSELTLDRDVAYEFYVESQDSIGNREHKPEVPELTVALGTVSTDDRNAGLDIAVYPNPVRGGGFFLRTTEDLGPVRLRCTDLLGRQLFERSVHLGAGVDVPVTIGAVPNGVYLLHIRSADGQGAVRRIVVRKGNSDGGARVRWRGAGNLWPS